LPDKSSRRRPKDPLVLAELADPFLFGRGRMMKVLVLLLFTALAGGDEEFFFGGSATGFLGWAAGFGVRVTFGRIGVWSCTLARLS
jgi:hypothetical protein